MLITALEIDIFRFHILFLRFSLSHFQCTDVVVTGGARESHQLYNTIFQFYFYFHFFCMILCVRRLLMLFNVENVKREKQKNGKNNNNIGAHRSLCVLCKYVYPISISMFSLFMHAFVSVCVCFLCLNRLLFFFCSLMLVLHLHFSVLLFFLSLGALLSNTNKNPNAHTRHNHLPREFKNERALKL